MDFKSITIPTVPSTRRYWFLRTENGKYYRDFKENGFIGYGLDKISNLKVISEAATAADAYEYLRSEVLKVKEKPRSATFHTRQIIKFVSDLKKGDIVIIPSKNSVEYSIGVIDSDVYLDDNYQTSHKEALNQLDVSYELCPFIKRRKVSWLTSLRRDKIPLQLLRFTFNHQALSEVTKHDTSIDRILYPIYTKNDITYLTLNVEQKLGISSISMANLLSSPLQLVELFKDSFHNQDLYDMSDVQSKVVVESPGAVQFIGNCSKIAAILLVVCAFGFGANIKINLPNHTIELDTKGLYEQYIESKKEDNRHEEEMAKIKLEEDKLKSSLNTMQISVPKELE